MLTGSKLAQYITGMETTQRDSEFWRAQNNLTKRTIVVTIHPSLAVRIRRLETAREGYETLQSLFEKSTTTPTATMTVQETRTNSSKRVAAYPLDSSRDRVQTRNEVTATSQRDDEVSNGSRRRRVYDVPSSNTHHEHECQTDGQGRVERRREMGEKGSKSNGRVDEKVTAATGPGKGAMDHKAGGVSLVRPTSSQENIPGTHIDTPSPPPPLTTPTLPVEQPAPASKRPTHQRSRDGHVPKNGTRRTHEDVGGSRREVESRGRGCSKVVDEDGDDTAANKATDATNPYANGAGTTTPVGRLYGPPNASNEGSRGGVKLRSRGSQGVDDEDGEDNDIHHAHAVPQGPHQTRQTAVEEATDTVNPNVKDVRPTMPSGMSNGPRNESNDVDEGVESSEGEKGERDERVSGDVAPSSNGENAVPNSTPPPPYPDESRPPPSVSLKGEMSGKQSSDHADEAATHLERPPDESTTTPPVWTPPDEKSSGEGQGVARGHRQTVGEEDEVEGSEDDGRKTDEARDDEDGQETREVEGMTDEGEEQQTAAMNANANGQYTSNEAGDLPPEPPPFPHHPAPPPLSPPPAPPSPSHPERHHDLDTTKSNTMAAQ
ncbi:hypothetical protein BDN67DRAFT_1012671 [Paxillus ammoniavirescens]|nr:hypothetical protein BDN67DRAFT_1012671 [Paxillus ammoniavirescens]